MTQVYLGQSPDAVVRFASKKPLCFIAEHGSSSRIILQKTGSNCPSLNLECSTDKKNWQGFVINQYYTIQKGQRLYIRASAAGNSTISYDTNSYYTFKIDLGHVTVSGDITTLLDQNGDVKDLSKSSGFAFCKLFYGQRYLKDASGIEFPSETLTTCCYDSMFYHCNSLTQAPALPAMNLAVFCYNKMFAGCTSLTKTPVLPATTLKHSCYEQMFQGCSSLSCVEVKFTDWVNQDSTLSWLDGVYYYGEFYCPAYLPDVTGKSNIPELWSKLDKNILCFTATSQDSKIGLASKYGWPENYNYLNYSTDGITWNQYTGELITLANNHDKVYFNTPDGVTNHSWGTDEYEFQFYITAGSMTAFGSIMSLVVKDGQTDSIPENEPYYFSRLFYECYGLDSAPQLPATRLEVGCYSHMFENCTSLTQAPALPATTLADFCYEGMFSMYSPCSLKYAPDLPATTLAYGCYEQMFYECQSLEHAPPVLPATTLAPRCYSKMFWDCHDLSNAPALPAEKLVSQCYSDMFSACISIKAISASFNRWQPSDATENWVVGIDQASQEGEFYCPADLPDIRGVDCIPTNWKKINKDNLLCFTATKENSTICLATEDGWIENYNYLNYLTDGSVWNSYSGQTIILENIGDKVYFNTPDGVTNYSWSNDYEFKFSMTGEISASGSIMSLVVKDSQTDSIPNEKYYFYGLFNGCSSLIQAPQLPATTLAAECYNSMFESCTSLTQAPALPATTLAYSCYTCMFYNCTSLTQAPALPATTLTEKCYGGMFESCTSLSSAPILPATTLTHSCYEWMFYNCESLIQAPELPATTLASQCYKNMFSYCTSLTQAPELPATTLAERCYGGMFESCTSLSSAPILPATTLAYECYSEMFFSCKSLTQAPELPATTLAERCYKSMFSYCTSLTQAPTLPATTLAYSCYEGMFYECSNLSTIDVSFTEWSKYNIAYYFTYSWVSNVKSTGNFYCPSSLLDLYDNSHIPEGWERIDKQ